MSNQITILREVEKYTGIYCIKVNDCIVYVSGTKDLAGRTMYQYDQIKKAKENKYQLLKTASTQGYTITVWLLEQCKGKDLAKRKGFWIRQLKPILNKSAVSTSQEFFDEVSSRRDAINGTKQIIVKDVESHQFRRLKRRDDIIRIYFSYKHSTTETITIKL